MFPGSLTPLAIGQDRSVRLVDDVVSDEPRILALVTSRNEDVEEPGWDDLYEIGTAAVVDKMVKVPDGTLRVLVRGLERIRLDRRLQDEPYLAGEFTKVPDVVVESDEVEALTRNVHTLFQRIIGLVPYLPEELQIALANVDEPTALVNFVASLLRIKTEEKQHLLELENVEERLRELLRLLNRELELLELGSRIQSQMQSEMEKGQREFFLRQQLKAIQEELGEGDEQQAELDRAARADRRGRAARRTCTRRRRASCRASRSCRRRRRSTASSAPTSTGSCRCPGRRRPRTTSTSSARARSSTRTTTTSRRSRSGSSSTSPFPSSRATCPGRSSASSGRPASARPRSGSRSPARSAASSRASRSAACATRRRSADTGGPTSARCPGRSSARSATPRRRTRCS